MSGAQRSSGEEGLTFHRLRPSWPGLYDGDWPSERYYGHSLHVHLRSTWPSGFHIAAAESDQRRQRIGRQRKYDIVRITVSLIVVAAILAAAFAYGR